MGIQMETPCGDAFLLKMSVCSKKKNYLAQKRHHSDLPHFTLVLSYPLKLIQRDTGVHGRMFSQT